MNVNSYQHRRLALGKVGELLAKDYLEDRGYVIIERNYRCSVGEIDIVARHGQTLCFVEVRTCSNDEFGHPLDSIGPKKQTKVRQVAGVYLSQRAPYAPEYRFDVIGVELNEAQEARLHLVSNAFYQGQS